MDILLHSLINPDMISALTTLVVSTIPILRYVSKKNKEQKQENDKRIEKNILDVQAQIDSLKMMLLRHEILDAVRNDYLSVEDIMGLYDQYKSLGGNSFITEEVYNYVKRRSDSNVKHNH